MMGSRLEKNSKATHKRIAEHTFDTEEGEEYTGSDFGGFSEYFRRKKIKLQNLDADLRAQSPDKPAIFRGIVAHVNGYTQPSLNDLHKLIVTHGGGFVQYLDGKTSATHIIAANLTPKKAIEFRSYRIVKPAWIVDSVANGKVLPWQSYKVLDEGVGQKTLGFEKGKVVNKVESRQKGYMDQTKTSWYNSQVKNIADEIDDEEEVLDVKSTRRTSDGRTTYTHSQSSHHHSQRLAHTKPNDDEITDKPDNELKLSNTESFELTSSLEDAMNAAESNIVASESAKIESRKQSPSGDAVEQIYDETIELRESISALPSPRGRKRSGSTETTLASNGEKPVTAEEHNTMLLADPKIRQSSTANPDFLKQFYSESRLHHLSTWKAELKSKFQQMASEQTLSQKNRLKRKPGSRRYVMHVDFDSFFCAVSLLAAPEYIDKPAVVAHGSGSGSEIASCNYPARDFGVKNGMWMKQAQKLCPDIKVLPYDFPAYEDASKKFYEAILSIGGVVQSVSIDEALVDISSLCLPPSEAGLGGSEETIRLEQKKADEIGHTVRRKIKDATNCEVSVGIGSNILLAKVALRKAKPAGQYQIKPEEVLDFIGELAVQNLPGVAYSIGGKLEEIGIKLVKDVRNSTKDRLMTVLGPKTGEKLWDYSRGIDHTEVGELITRKSVSAEVNWGIRFINQPEAEEFVKNLCGELHKRLMNGAVKGRQLTVKIMRKSADSPLDPAKHLGHGKCDVFNKSVSLGVATNAVEILAKEAISVLRAFGFSPGELRGLGVQMTKLEPIKHSVDGRPDGSQKTLSFPKPPVPRPPRHEILDPIDDPETPRKSKATPNRPCADIEDIDPDSPLKPRATPVHPAAAITRANAADPSAVKPLNLTGTQFILPTQVDPTVLAELPSDIRSRLLAQSKGTTPSRASPWSNLSRPASESRSKAPTPEPNSPSANLVPPPAPLPSQLDPEVFESLPEDVKAEVLASYGSIRGNLPQQRVASLSPRKTGKSNLAKKPTTPTKKNTSLLFKSRHSKSTSNSTLVQSNFFTDRKTESSTRPGDIANDADAIDPDFLAAIPEDMRDEIIAEHKRARLATRSGLVAPIKTKKRPPEPPQGQRKLQLPPRPPKPTFTTADISVLPDLRQTISQWYSEFRNEGPHEDDVKAMERYLRRVVLDEKDMAKAVSVVKWMVWLIYDSGGDGFQTEIGEKGWREALDGIKEHIQQAVSERGVGSIDFNF
jgi:DNA repair protein REV1